MQRGKVDVVLFGADRVAQNGDVANKVGTYKVRAPGRQGGGGEVVVVSALAPCAGAQMCVVARENGIPAYACVPTSTIDLNIPDGLAIPIEERSATEVTTIDGALP
jgi:methylthioribose-1-phosphate isomerase